MLARVPVALRVDAARPLGVSVPAVRAAAEAMLRALGLRRAELSIVLCDDRAMRELNRRHRGKDRTTDVLAFALREGPALAGADSDWLGDVVISVPTAARQAREAKKMPADEVRMLLAHGLLHLLGFDHQTAAQARRMSARTDALLAASAPAPRTLRGEKRDPRARARRLRIARRSPLGESSRR